MPGESGVGIRYSGRSRLSSGCDGDTSTPTITCDSSDYEGRRQKADGGGQKGFALLPLPAHSPEAVIIVLPAFRFLPLFLPSAFCLLPHLARLFVIFVRYSFALATAAGTSTVKTFRFRIRTRPSQIVATTLLPEAAYTIADSTE